MIYAQELEIKENKYFKWDNMLQITKYVYNNVI